MKLLLKEIYVLVLVVAVAQSRAGTLGHAWPTKPEGRCHWFGELMDIEASP